MNLLCTCSHSAGIFVSSAMGSPSDLSASPSGLDEPTQSSSVTTQSPGMKHGVRMSPIITTTLGPDTGRMVQL